MAAKSSSFATLTANSRTPTPWYTRACRTLSRRRCAHRREQRTRCCLSSCLKDANHAVKVTLALQRAVLAQRSLHVRVGALDGVRQRGC